MFDIAVGLVLVFALSGALFVIARRHKEKEKENARQTTTYSQWQQDYLNAGNTIHSAPKLRPVRVNRVVQPVVIPAAPVSAAPVQQDNSLLYGVIGYELGRLAGENHSHQSADRHSVPLPDRDGGFGVGGATDSWDSSDAGSSYSSGYSGSNGGSWYSGSSSGGGFGD